MGKTIRISLKTYYDLKKLKDEGKYKNFENIISNAIKILKSEKKGKGGKSIEIFNKKRLKEFGF